MELRTGISKMTDDDFIIHGEALSDLVDAGFSHAIFLILSGRKPTEQEEILFSSMLTLIIDHGMGVSSAMSARMVMSTGNSLNAAAAAGILALGKHHGGAIGDAMEQMQDITDVSEFVNTHISQKKVIYGFGHKIYKKADPRVVQMLEIVKRQGYDSMFVKQALAIEKEIEAVKGKKIILNIDGFIAAVLLEMGFSPKMGSGFFLVGRLPGLIAHAVEEKDREKPVRRFAEKDIVYDGK